PWMAGMHVTQEQLHAFIPEAKVPKDLSQPQTRSVPAGRPTVSAIARSPDEAQRNAGSAYPESPAPVPLRFIRATGKWGGGGGAAGNSLMSPSLFRTRGGTQASLG